MYPGRLQPRGRWARGLCDGELLQAVEPGDEERPCGQGMQRPSLPYVLRGHGEHR